jgi:hypothetical protein
MNKTIFLALSILFLSANLLEGQTYAYGRWRTCRGCRCYWDLISASYDGLPYGYVDNLNYPEPYELPLNRCFNYCPPCRPQPNNQRYFWNCVRNSSRFSPNG